MNLTSDNGSRDTAPVHESYPPAAKLSWRVVALSLGLAALGVLAWRWGAPDLLVGGLVGGGLGAAPNGWRR